MIIGEASHLIFLLCGIFDSAERLQYLNLHCLRVQPGTMACRFKFLVLFMTHQRGGL